MKKNITQELSSLKKLRPEDLRKELFKLSKRLPDIFHLRHIVFFSIIFSVAIVILFSQRFYALGNYTSYKAQPGGSYSEGIIGEVKRINSIFSPVNPAEEDVVKLIYSGLIKINENGQPEGDLAESWKISEDGKTYEFELRKNIKWHDDKKLTADDILFTINAIQNPDTRSPLFQTWKGVKAEKLDDYKIRFILDKPLRNFIDAASLGILPKHLLEKVPAPNLKLAEFNEAPVGSGPFVLKKFDKKKDSTELTLLSNKKYYKRPPYIEKFILKTYGDEGHLLNGYLKKEIQGISRISVLNLEEAAKLKDIRTYEKSLPEYTALFYNGKNEILKDKEIRKALSKAIDKGKINEIFSNQLITRDNPVLPGMGGILKTKDESGIDKANSALDNLGWKNENGVRKKEGKELSFTLVTGDTAEYRKVAQYIAEALKTTGISVKVEAKNFYELEQNNLRPRNYDMLLFTENLGPTNDLYPFWHSSGKNDPGLNLAYFEDKKVDKYLEIARETLDDKKNQEMLVKAQEIIFEEKPALFLYSAPYIYGVSGSVKGIDIKKIRQPKDRFNNVEDWYFSAR